MNFSIAFRNLPFTPVKNQVIYIENEYSEYLNTYIRHNYYDLKNMYKRHRKEFVYLPLLSSDENIEEKVRYYAPYIQSDIVYPELPKSDLLLSFMAHPENRSKIPPSLVWFYKEECDEFIFKGKTIENVSQLMPESDLNKIPVDGFMFSLRTPAHSIDASVCESRKKDRVNPCASPIPHPKIDDTYYSRYSLTDEITSVNEDLETDTEDIDVERAIHDLNRTVARLQLKGITLAAIHEMIDKQEKLSRMVISPDYRIFLPDYGNREIDITPKAKALYFLFLRYPKGVRIKELTDHHKELYNIYHQLKPNFNEAKLDTTITALTNPFGNRINEAMSLIRAAFLREFDEHLAQHYFITGIAGEEYKITLDRNLIEWQED